MKRAFFIAAALFMLMTGAPAAGAGLSEENGELFVQAARYYERGDYGKAFSAYSAVLKKGFESGPLYYNAGNCFLQEGESIGKAIFFYEMARRLIPRDTALRANLRYARSLMKQADTPSSEPFALFILRRAFGLFTIGEAFALWNAAYFGCAAIFVLSLFMKRNKALLRVVSVLLLCFCVLMLIPLKSKMNREEMTGVVVAAIVDARLEPFEDAASKFPLYEGMEVDVLKTTRQWHKVKRPDGKVGWIPQGTLWRLAAPPW